MPPTPPRSRRVDTMIEQLDRTTDEYTAAKEIYDSARVEYNVAREKFTSVRRLAMNVLSKNDWWRWRATHDQVLYSGLKIGEAIVEALEIHAYESASEYLRSGQKTPYSPAMTLEQLQEVMERGGFEFRTNTPLREVHAATINLERVTKTGTRYAISYADMILQDMGLVETAKRVATAPATVAIDNDDNVPF